MTETTMISHKKELSESQILIGILAIFLIGFGLRLVNLGTAPFTAGEAQAAWQALQVARKLPAETAANAAYQGLTAVTFAIMQANAFLGALLAGFGGCKLSRLCRFFGAASLAHS